MFTTHRWIMLGSLAGSLILWSGMTHAQDRNAAAIHYGDGVHAYFAGNCSRAEQSLSNALTYESQDPRIYYFRALSLLRQGRIAEARGDMMVGAALEAQRPNRFAVGTALIRVQGRDRLLLEQYRRQARLEASAGGTSYRQAAPATHTEVLRERVVVPLEELLQPGAPSVVAPSEPQPPARRTFAPSEPSPPTQPAGRAPAGTTEDPFRDDRQTPPSAPPAITPPPTSPAPSGAPVESPPAGSGDEDPFAEFQ